jgi:hypothetical protein
LPQGRMMSPLMSASLQLFIATLLSKARALVEQEIAGDPQGCPGPTAGSIQGNSLVASSCKAERRAVLPIDIAVMTLRSLTRSVLASGGRLCPRPTAAPKAGDP